MDAKVQRIIRTAGPVIGSLKEAGTSKCPYHLRLKGLLHDLMHGSVLRDSRAGECARGALSPFEHRCRGYDHLDTDDN